MVDLPSPRDGDDGARRGALAVVVTWAGAILSVGLVAGLTVWGYRLAVRDVSGVPVIRALEGPMRIAPEDPGGSAVSHQGLAVNRVAAVGTAEPPPEQVALAPRPLDIAADDRPAAPPSPPAPIAAVLAPTAPLPLPLPEEEGAVTGALEDGEVARADLAGDPAADPLAEAALAAVAEALGEPAAGPLPPGVIGRSIRPLPRPAVPGRGTDDAMAAAALRAAQAALATAEGARELDQAGMAPGTRLVQLGAYPDAVAARAAWDAIAARFGALFDGRDRVLQTAERGGQSFVRLRVAGFSDDADSRQFCAALKAEDTPCTPVLLR
ncbi:MAG: SPOR domain-containing protein [Rhodobacteraceae bacterium]|nr:SPOR domain-containing protein [Paracoccaceae bacterium]